VLQVFKAVIVPGPMAVVVMMAIAIAGALRHATARTPFTFGELARSVPRAVPVLLNLDGGIFSGVFTPGSPER
jgi:TRAP-type C4-dicarboxylate transport system permease large subunit